MFSQTPGLGGTLGWVFASGHEHDLGCEGAVGWMSLVW